MHYHNEHDPFAAEWLRNLIKAGHLPEGTVDDRDIQTITGTALGHYTQAHFFAGIGGWSHALRLAGWPEGEPVWTGSCPCQPFSAAGAGRAEKDERHLWPVFRDLIAHSKPPVVFGEQVASKLGREWLSGVRHDLEALGYEVGAADLCAPGVGSPHIRQRLFWVADRPGQRLADAHCPGPQGRVERGNRPDQLPAGPGGMACGVADAGGSRTGRNAGDGRGPQAGVCGPGNPNGDQCLSPVPCGCENCRVAVAEGQRHERTEPERPGHVGERARTVGGGSNVGLANAKIIGFGQGPAVAGGNGEGTGPRERTGSAGDRHLGWMGDTNGPRPIEGRHGPEADGHGRPAHPDGGTGGFWSAAETIRCRDGKSRRAKSGVFPLAHGIPRDLGRTRAILEQMGHDPKRVKSMLRRPGSILALAGRCRAGRLRGYGNAIIPELAAMFIRSYMEARGMVKTTGV